MQAGWAEVDITSAWSIPIGGRCVPPSWQGYVMDRQVAQAIVLRDARGRSAVIISLDTVGVTPSIADRLRDDAAAIARCDRDAVLVNASHTHSGPDQIWDYYSTDEPTPEPLTRYVPWFFARVKECVTKAASSLQPVRALWHEGQTSIAINRRLRTDAGVEHRPNPDGDLDPRLYVLLLDRGPDQALLLSCACHPVAVYGAWPDASSSDFVGAARDALRQMLGSATHVQFAQGFAGDCRPRILADLERRVFRPAAVGDVQRIGDELAAAVVETLARPGDPITLRLAHAHAAMPVRAGRPIPAAALNEMARSDNPVTRQHAQWWLCRLETHHPFDAVMPWSIGALALDDAHWIVHMAGEPVQALGDVVRSACDGRAVATWGYTQDYTTYLPTDAMLPEGGYEVDGANIYQRVWPAQPARGIDQMVFDHTRTLAHALRGD